MTPALNPRQEQILLFIQRTLAVTSRAPTIEAIRQHCLLNSKSSVHRVLDELERMGHIERLRYARRAIAVVRPIPDDRFEDAARAACEALGCDASPDNIARAREALVSRLIEKAAA